MRRWFYWLGVASAVVLLAGGATVAVRSYARTSGVDGVVRGYFAALGARRCGGRARVRRPARRARTRC